MHQPGEYHRLTIQDRERGAMADARRKQFCPRTLSAQHQSATLLISMHALAKKLTALATLCLILVGCAQTGPPLPPSLELPKPPSDLRAIRKGNTVTLTWTAPVRTTDRQTVRSTGPTRICRGAGPLPECGTPVDELPAAVTGRTETGLKHVESYADNL